VNSDQAQRGSGEPSYAPLGRIVDLRPPGSFLVLSRQYGGSDRNIIDEVIGQAYALGAQMAFIEYEQPVPDERRGRLAKEARFQPVAGAHRIHFFLEPPSDHGPELGTIDDLSNLTYLGCVVMRLDAAATIDQTLLPPPPDLRRAVSCTTECEVNVFGYRLSTHAAPFISVDAHSGGRVEASIWMCASLHARRRDQPRLLPENIAEVLPSGLGIGYSITQIAEASRALGLPALIYNCQRLPPNETIGSIAARYLNSGMPLMAVTHARSLFVLIGCLTFGDTTGVEPTHYVLHDSEVGPYQVAASTDVDGPQSWENLIIPCPEEVLLTGTVGQEVGKTWIHQALESRQSPRSGERHPPSDAPLEALAFRSTLVLSDEFKNQVSSRGAPSLLESIYRSMPMPRWIWVVEALDVRPDNEPAIVADVLIDATERTRDMRFVAMRLPGELWSWLPGTDNVAIRPIPAGISLTSIAQAPIRECEDS
jgi:hypothetical protein